MGLLTTAEVADKLGVHRTRVNVLIQEGRLPAKRFGRAFLVEEKDLELVADRKTGRPPKPTENAAAKPAKKTSTKKKVKLRK